MISITDYIQKQEASRAQLMQAIHQIILQNDLTVKASIDSMMGKEMILYKDRGVMKYGLASVKDYMSMHILPIYGGSPLHAKYVALLPDAKFQKGCINFKSALDVPLDIIAQLFADCAPVDLIAIRNAYLQSKKTKK